MHYSILNWHCVTSHQGALRIGSLLLHQGQAVLAVAAEVHAQLPLQGELRRQEEEPGGA